jgi:hypothetical protein
MKSAVIAAVAFSAFAGSALAAQAAAPNPRPSVPVDPRPYNARDVTGVWTQATRPDFGPIALTPEYAAIQKQQQDDRRAGKLPPEDVSCTPGPLITMMTAPFGPLEFSTIGDERMVIAKSNGSIYRVYFKRPHKAAEDLEPLLFGDAVGRWEGDTLVIDTVGLTAEGNIANAPHSDVTHVIQRIRRTAYNKLEDQITIEDSKAFAHPVTGTVTYDLTPQIELDEFYCTNNRIVLDAEGKVGIAPAVAR